MTYYELSDEQKRVLIAKHIHKQEIQWKDGKPRLANGQPLPDYIYGPCIEYWSQEVADEFKVWPMSGRTTLVHVALMLPEKRIYKPASHIGSTYNDAYYGALLKHLGVVK